MPANPAVDVRLQHLMDASFDPVLVVVDGCLVACNEAFVELLGYPTMEALLGARPADLVAPVALAAVLDHVERSPERTYETLLKRRDGVLVPVEVRGTNWVEGDQPVRVTVVRDITERKRREHLLAQYGGAMLEHSPDAIIRFDRDFRYVYVNPVVGRNLGKAPESFTGRTMAEAGVSPERVDFWTSHMRAVLESGTERCVEFDFTDAQGRLRYQQAMLTPEPDGVLVTVRDITTLKRAELDLLAAHQRLKDSERYKDEFLSVVSHELRTPLNFIMGFASVLEDGLHGPLNHAQRRDVDRILEGADRMLGLVDDLLDYAHLRAGTVELVRQPVDVRLLLAEASGGAAVEAPAGLTFALDAARMRQALDQLVENARKFSPPGSPVVLRARLEEGELVLEVEDHGCGIPREALAGLFERFRQFDMTSTRRAGGMGLGLAIARALVEAHGGRIEADSTPGQGSTFRLRLPF
jgi:protein-histidine pros-kinase